MASLLISSDWLRQHLSDTDLVLLDTRPKTLFVYGHLHRAQSVSIEQVIKFDEFGSHLVADERTAIEVFGSMGIDECKTVVVVGDTMDPSAARIAWTLLYFGHEKTLLLDANASDLQGHGFELTRQKHVVVPATFTPKVNPDIHIDYLTLNDNLENLQILDARMPQEFMGGSIPNSKLIPFTEGVDHLRVRLFEDEQFLEEMFLQNGISQEKETVCYCMHGHRASNLFFQLKIAGFKRVRLYDGSFVQWSGKRSSSSSSSSTTH